MVKICSLSVDGPGPAQLPRESTGGGGYSRAVPAGVSPINTRQNKKPSLKKSRKTKKAQNDFYKSALRAQRKICNIEILNSILTYRYYYDIFKPYRRCDPCRLTRQLGK